MNILKTVDLILSVHHTESMSSMFDKLGDMLNECLEKGEIPQPQPQRTYYQKTDFAKDEATVNQQNGTDEQVEVKKTLITLPRDVEEALKLLGFGAENSQQEELFIPSIAEVRGAYAQLLKEAHPDTATQETSSAQAAQRIAQLTSALNKVREWYKKLEQDSSK